MDKDLYFGNEYKRFKIPLSSHRWAKMDVGEGRYRAYTIGCAVFWSPFFFLAHFLVKIFNFFGATIPQDGFSFPYQYFITFGSLAYVFGGIYLCLKITSFYFTKKVSYSAMVSIFAASSLFYYAIIESSMSHSVSFFIVSLLLYYCIFCRDEASFRYWILVGFLAGLAFLVRYQNVLFLIFPAYFAIKYLITLFKPLEIKKIIILLGNALLCFTVLAITIFPQLLFLRLFHGKLLSNPSALHPVFYDSNWHLVLFSTWHGLFSWTPIILFAVIGLFHFAKKDKNTAIALALCFFIQVYIYGVVVSSQLKIGSGFGHAFGMRWLINCTPVFILGMAGLLSWLLKKMPRAKAWVKFSLVIFVVWNLLFIVQYKLNFIPTDHYLTFKQVVLDKFALPSRVIEHINSRF